MNATCAKLACCVFLGMALLIPFEAESQSRLSFRQALADGEGGVNSIEGTLDLVMSPDGRFVYSVAQNDGAVSVFRRDASTGLLTFVEALVSGIGGVSGVQGAQGIEMSPDGLSVYTASIGAQSIAAFRRDPSSGRLTFVEAESQNGSQFLSQLEEAAVSPDGRHLYAAVFQGGIVVHRRDLESAALDFVQRVDGAITGARELKLSPDGAFLYVAAGLDDSVGVFSRDPATGALAQVAIYTNGSGGIDSLAGARGIALGPAGRTLYALSSTNDEGTVSIFDRDHATGGLSLRNVIRDGRDGPLGLWGAHRIDIDASGRWAYVVCIFSGAIVVFERDPATGDLTFFERIPGATGGVAVSPDERYLYVSTFRSIRVYAIDSPEESCTPRLDVLCLRDRFAVAVSWNDGRGGQGVGTVVPDSSDTTGLFWFFQPKNWELQVKVLNGCANNGHFWVFASASTNVEYTLTVTDTQSGAVQDYVHPFGSPAPAITDTQAFATCP